MSSTDTSKHGDGCTDKCKEDPCACAEGCECKEDCKCTTCSAPCKCTEGNCACGEGCEGPDSCGCDRKCDCK